MSSCSVIIPVRNGERYIAQAIQSLLRQILPPLEIIVVDDGSKDQTAQVLQRFSARITVIRLDGGGASAARNRGIQMARGEFIAFLDCDDTCHPQRLEKQLEALKCDDRLAMTYCAMAYMDEAGHSTGEEIRYPAYNSRGFWGKMLERNRIGSTSTAMVRKKVLEAVGGFDERLAYNEEYDLWLRIGAKWDIHYLDEVLVHYRLHGGNISRWHAQQRLNELHALRKHPLKKIRKAIHLSYPDPTEAELAYARMLYRLERYTEAESKMTSLKAGGYKNVLLEFFLGNIAWLKGNLNLAKRRYRSGLRLSPEFAPCCNNLGIVRANKGDLKASLRAFRKASELKPNYNDPRHNIECLLTGELNRMRCTMVPLREVLKPIDLSQKIDEEQCKTMAAKATEHCQ